MERLIDRAAHFPYHSFRYEYPSKPTVLVQRPDYLLVAEPDNPLRGKRYRLFWAARSVEALLTGMSEIAEMLTTERGAVTLFLEHIPPEFVPALEKARCTVVSEWIDFWIDDLGACTFEPLPTQLIRQMRQEECSTAAAITRACMGGSREFYGETEESVQEWFADSDTDILVAEENGQIVGICEMAHYGFDHPKGSVAWLRELCVHPAYQYRGIGRALAIRGLIWGQERKAQRSFLATDVENHHAIRLYEALGYRRRDERGQINVVWVKE